MKIAAVLAAAAASLTLGACSMFTAGGTPPLEADVGPPTQARWDAGNAAYLAWNSRQRGWTVTESGLQYKRISRPNPSGRQPTATDTVRVHYQGTFIDGREFDSSYARNEPAEFPLNRVIKGWTEGVALMHEGETYLFVIPASLAYGDRWVGGDELPPNSTLIFKVELLEVK